jgi:hypothetical protein
MNDDEIVERLFEKLTQFAAEERDHSLLDDAERYSEWLEEQV